LGELGKLGELAELGELGEKILPNLPHLPYLHKQKNNQPVMTTPPPLRGEGRKTPPSLQEKGIGGLGFYNESVF